MKKTPLLIVLGLAALAPLLFLGCETESSADLQLTLEPRSATLRKGQSAVFTVSGGYQYRWNLINETIGRLNTRTGNQVIYTVTSTNAATQILTVESFIEGSSGSAPTNAVNTNEIRSTVISATITQPGS
ncbi:MAG: hypothetical protein R6X19_02035 [Kiritimatiellia bacterium]